MATATHQQSHTSQRSRGHRATGDGRRGIVPRQVAAAERAVLIEVGALLRARDGLLDAAKSLDTAKSIPTDVRDRVASELRESERRGLRARNGLRREMQRQRRRIERTIRRERRART